MNMEKVVGAEGVKYIYENEGWVFTGQNLDQKKHQLRQKQMPRRATPHAGHSQR